MLLLAWAAADAQTAAKDDARVWAEGYGMILADRVRRFVILNYIEPARNRSERSVVVVARDIVKGLGLKNRSAAVCNALDAEKFLADNRLSLSERTGPKQGRTVAWVLEIESTASIDSRQHCTRPSAQPRDRASV